MAEKLPVILDSRGDNTVVNALRRLLPNLPRMDIATGVFEVGAFRLLEDLWRSLSGIRILMGDETTRRTRREIVQGLREASHDSIEREKEREDALSGLPAVREAIAAGRIAVRVYSKAKFHAKSYLMESHDTSPVDLAIVGSSNFTRPGLTENLELNLFSTDQVHIENLRRWYQELWAEADDVREEILRTAKAQHLVFLTSLLRGYAVRLRT